MNNNYIPNPINTADVTLPEDVQQLAELLAKNCHEVWAAGRVAQGWRYGPVRDDEKKETPCLVSYEELSEEEKDYDRNTSLETLKLIIKLGYTISRP